MFHGDIDLQTAEGIKLLRKRIEDAQIPASKLDETLNIATWNIREFGKVQRSDAAVHYIAEIVGQFDVVAIVELRDNLGDLDRVMAILGPFWRVVYSDYNTDPAGNRERIGFLYDRRAADITGLAAEADPPRKKNPQTGEYEAAIEWWRSPYMASFIAGSYEFTLLSAHVRWGGDSSAARVPELQTLADWIDARVNEPQEKDKELILMGDFNIPDDDDATYKAITSKGLEIPDALRGEHGSNLAQDKRYDQILHYPKFSHTFSARGGVLDFYRNDWRSLFPAAQYPDMTKAKFTFQLSDHLPLWVQIDTWTEDEQLDELIEAKKKEPASTSPAP
ncbi:MAG TPA: endonuclease/exonuclease/phosphatase family protein [Dehalococcoidia bacterium]|nr:endonuclease/exonuclease/phosphatase family protein [Dehalococcoidia bacterium]